MQDERGRRHLRQELTLVRGQVELEERGRHVGLGRPALVGAERGDLVAARMRGEEAGEHLRREQPVRPDEVDQRVAGRVGDVIARRIAAEVDDFADPLGVIPREPRGGETGARAREDDRRLVAALVEDGAERPGLGLDRRRRCVAVREADADAVVPDDAVRARERLEEASHLGQFPLILQMRDPACAEDEQRAFADGRVREAPPVELTEADLLLHHPHRSCMTRTLDGPIGPCQEDGPRRGSGAAWLALTMVSCIRVP